MEKTSQQLEKLILKKNNEVIFESPSFIAIQNFVKELDDKNNLQLIYSFNNNIVCEWPTGRNYYFSKKLICFPSGHKLEYRYIGYTQGKMLIKMRYRWPEMVLLEKEQLLVTEKDKDFMLY